MTDQATTSTSTTGDDEALVAIETAIAKVLPDSSVCQINIIDKGVYRAMGKAQKRYLEAQFSRIEAGKATPDYNRKMLEAMRDLLLMKSQFEYSDMLLELVNALDELVNGHDPGLFDVGPRPGGDRATPTGNEMERIAVEFIRMADDGRIDFKAMRDDARAYAAEILYRREYHESLRAAEKRDGVPMTAKGKERIEKAAHKVATEAANKVRGLCKAKRFVEAIFDRKGPTVAGWVEKYTDTKGSIPDPSNAYLLLLLTAKHYPDYAPKQTRTKASKIQN